MGIQTLILKKNHKKRAKINKKTSESTNKKNSLFNNSDVIQMREEHSSFKICQPQLKNSYTEGQPIPQPTYSLLCSISLPP